MRAGNPTPGEIIVTGFAVCEIAHTSKIPVHVNVELRAVALHPAAVRGPDRIAHPFMPAKVGAFSMTLASNSASLKSDSSGQLQDIPRA